MSEEWDELIDPKRQERLNKAVYVKGYIKLIALEPELLKKINALHAAYAQVKEENKLWLDWTKNQDEHPENWEGPCYCSTCLSYGEIDEIDEGGRR